MSVYLGLDIGGTKIAGAIVSEDGMVVRKAVRPTPAREGRESIVTSVVGVAREIWMPDVVAAGVGTGGQVDATRGVVVSATDLLPGWAGTNLGPLLEDALSVSVAVDNDVNALAIGEYRFGAARGKEIALFLALGTGVGGAALINGKLLRGAHWSGAEFGHLLLTMDDDSRRDGGGRSGTLEAYVSGGGLVQTWREITGDREGCDTARDIVKLPGGEEAVRQTGRYLGFGLASLANLFDPDIIIIGGGLGELGDRLLNPARQVLKERALPGPAQCPVVGATLGPDASVIGAAALAITRSGETRDGS